MPVVRKKATAVVAPPRAQRPNEKPFNDPMRPRAKGKWREGGKLPLCTVTRTLPAIERPAVKGVVEDKDAHGPNIAGDVRYNLAADLVTLKAGDTVRFVEMVTGTVASVLPGAYGCRVRGAPRLDAVQVPLDSLK